MAAPLSGTQYRLASGDHEAIIASVGSSIRSLTYRGRDLVVPFAADEMRPRFRGATLVPWPNRVVDGTWGDAGAPQRLALTEPERGHALHGLMVWVDYDAVERSEDSVTLAATVQPQAGYPFRLDVRVAYRLDAHGLHTTVTASNTGHDAAPFGTAAHPYLVAGDGRVDDWTLELPASRVMEALGERLLPGDVVDVEGTGFDFRTPRALAGVELDHAFTGLADAAPGRREVRVTAPGGTGTVIRFDADCPWVQVHTADLPDPEVSRLGLAVEPMTCPPDAFNSGTDLVVLEPDETVEVGWSIAALEAGRGASG